MKRSGSPPRRGPMLRLVAGNGKSVGYLLHARIARVEELGEAIRRIARGESVVDP